MTPGVMVAADKTISDTFPGAITTGNVLVAIASANAATNATTFAFAIGGQAFTNAIVETPDSDFSTCVAIAYRIVDGTEASQQVDLTVTATSTPDCGLVVVERDDLDTADLLEKTASTAHPDNATLVLSRASGTTATLDQADNLVYAAWSCFHLTTGVTYSGTGNTILFSGQVSGFSTLDVIRFQTAATTAVSRTRSWTSPSTTSTAAIAVFKLSASTSPVLTVPSDGLQFTSESATALAGLDVDAGSSSITTVTISVPAGQGIMTMTEDGTSVVSGNGTNPIIITGGSEANIKATLATLTFQGGLGVYGSVTISVVVSDGTLTDSGSFFVLNDPLTLTMTVVGTAAQMTTAVESVYGSLLSGTSGTVTVAATDSGGRSNSGIVTLQAFSGPIVSIPGTQVSTINVPKAIQGISVSDPDSDLDTIRVQTVNATTTLTTNGTSVTAGSLASTDYTIQGTQANLNLAIDSLVFTGTSLGSQDITITGTDATALEHSRVLAVIVEAATTAATKEFTRYNTAIRPEGRAR